MSGFAPTGSTCASRPTIARATTSWRGAARAHFGGRRPIRVVDLGCGTGSNLRATAPLLGAEQHWTLVDYDPAPAATPPSRGSPRGRTAPSGRTASSC